jgi:hypothetical protein
MISLPVGGRVTVGIRQALPLFGMTVEEIVVVAFL